MNVTVCQIDPRESDLNNYLKALSNHLQSEKSDFLLLPEMCFSEWLAADQNSSAKRWLKAVNDHGQHIDNLDKLGVASIIGTRPIINDKDSRRNQAYIWSKETNTATGFHEKYYLPDEEEYWENTWYERGEKEFQVVRAGDAVCGVQICTEMWFFEWARKFAASRVDLLCIPRATPHGSTDKWLAGGQASAVCSGTYCLSSNLWCPPGDKANCGGLAWIIDPEGEILAQTSEDDPFATVAIDLTYSSQSKSTYPRYVPE